jgi:hypothetical protein
MKIYYSPVLHVTIENAHFKGFHRRGELRFQNFSLRFPILTHTTELHDDFILDI